MICAPQRHAAPTCWQHLRGSPHNRFFLDVVRAALVADAALADGRHEAAPVKGMRAFSTVYAAWAFSQDFFRDEEYRKLGMQSVDDVVAFVEGFFGQRDANDLLAMLRTWWQRKISASDRFKGDFTATLRSITAGAIVMPGERRISTFACATTRSRSPQCRTRDSARSRPAGAILRASA